MRRPGIAALLVVVAGTVVAMGAVGAPPSGAAPVVITYDVKGKGNTTDLESFAQLAAETLATPAGWSLGGAITFERVKATSDFTLWLSSAADVPSFGPPCGSTYSCSFGRNVAVNETRWLEGSPSWNDAGGSLRDYRHMVVNHEVGHWLGIDHEPCPGAGQPAPIMQQQSIDLAGCLANAWPLERERQVVATDRGVKIIPGPPPGTVARATSSAPAAPDTGPVIAVAPTDDSNPLRQLLVSSAAGAALVVLVIGLARVAPKARG